MKSSKPPELNLLKNKLQDHLVNRISYISLELPPNACSSSRPSSTYHQKFMETSPIRPQTTISASVIHTSPLFKTSIKPYFKSIPKSPQSQSLLKSTDSTSRRILEKAAEARLNPIDKYLGRTIESILEPITSLSVQSLKLKSPRIDSFRYLPLHTGYSARELNSSKINRKLQENSSEKSCYRLKNNVIQFEEGARNVRVINNFSINKKRKERKNTEKKQKREAVNGKIFLKGKSPLVIRPLFNMFK